MFAIFKGLPRALRLGVVAMALILTELVSDVHGQKFEVNAEFSTAETTVGREVTYTIAIRKAQVSDDDELILKSPDRPVLPKINALTIGRFQTSEQYQSTLGSDPVGITMEFEIIANAEGRIVMPSFDMNYMGEVLHVPAALLKVRSPENDLTGGEIEWFRLELAETPESLLVGQRFKTSLNLYVFRGLRNVTFSKPVSVGSDFSLDQISPGPTERMVTEGLYRYRVYSWPLTYSAVRSGKISVGFKLNLNFRIPNDRLEFIRAARANDAANEVRIEELLADSREESQAVFSENLNFEVSKLSTPSDGSTFFNGIGDFEIKSSIDNTNLQVGKPANIEILVSGEGNFDALKTPKLPLAANWRVFEPQEVFEDEDFLGYKGKMVYRFVVIPLRGDMTEFPAVKYTFYDVNIGGFETAETDPIPLAIIGDNIVQSSEVLVAPLEEETEDQAVVSLTSSVRWDLGKLSRLRQPFFYSIQFYGVQFLILIGFLLMVGLRWRTIKIEKDKVFARHLEIQSWKKKYVKLAEQAAKTEDSEQFYESAFLAFCAIVASDNDANVEAITVEDVMVRLDSMSLNDNVKRVIGEYLGRYEEHRFSSDFRNAPPLVHEFKRLKTVLAQFDKQLGESSVN